ncbi:hypothetical protein N7466_011123 [Penicillium verhagenii]|uniref:uncharacterized protein n=1 Tax=Penicillium verhagenii TaxID=1562060 RepID=UPI002544E14A|nr:uncharacterized protein N7466_011123 [Penicillium verhagenii]KAJ5917569.1 hypothetical protein N7466_011123 [Penicillium verhagenii]
MQLPACDPTTVRKVLEFAYKGQYAVGTLPAAETSKSMTGGDHQEGPSRHTRLRSRAQALTVSSWASDEMHWHPSSLHLKMYAAADDLSFASLRLHAEQALLASLGILFSHSQFKTFILELYSIEKYSKLRNPVLAVIVANLKKFKLPDYTLIDDELLDNVPRFRDHLLSELIRKHCQDTPHLPSFFDSNAAHHEAEQYLLTSEGSQNKHKMVAHGIFINQKDILRTVQDLFINPIYSDLTVICGGFVLHVHKAVLCPASGYITRICEAGNGNSSGEIQLGSRDPILVKSAFEFVYTGRYTGGPYEYLGGLTDEASSFHARMFAEAAFLEMEDLKAQALKLLLSSLVANLNRFSLNGVIDEVYSPRSDGVNLAEARGALLDLIVDELINLSNWNWGWITDPLEYCPEFGSEICLALVSRGLLVSLRTDETCQ